MTVRKYYFLYIPFFLPTVLAILFILNSSEYSLIIPVVSEMFLIYIAMLAIKKHVIFTPIWICYLIVLGLQISSIYTSGNFIIPLTLSNANEIKALGVSLGLKLFAITLSFFAVSFFILLRKNIVCSNKVPLLLIPLIVFPYCNGPLLNLYFTTEAYYKQLTFSPGYNYPEMAKKYLKVGVWNNSIDNTKVELPNVIVIFTEGMSSAVIDNVNGKGLRLTPQIDSIKDNSLVFKNYFNHTAATFRGLRGQLSSAYQYKDGVGANRDGFFEISNDTVKATFNKRLVSLPEILNNHGYKTLFLSSTERDSTLNTMLKTMSFHAVYGMGDFEFFQNDRMTDKQTFDSLKKLVKNNIQNKFFIGVYTSGTHHGMNSPDMIYKNGENHYYNKFYNYDHQLGDFVNFMKDNKYLDNTILIITSDHSTFPTPEFNKSFGLKAKYFVDTIPLYILGAGIKHKVIDAEGSNSLSLTPTILNLLKINNEPNFFLGCSLLDKRCKSRFSNISAIGDSFYKTEAQTYPDYNVFQTDTAEEIQEFYKISG